MNAVIPHQNDELRISSLAWLSIRIEKKMILVESNDEIKEMMRLDAIGAQ